MKTVMDAVKWFKGGDLCREFSGNGLEACDWVLLECVLPAEDCADKVGDICTGGVEFDSGFYRLICDYHSYIVEVSLLSRAPWIKGASLEEYMAADKEVLKMENKTAEFDGMVYEIGKLYEFSDPSDYSYLNIETLTSIDVNDDFPFKTNKSSYWYCRAVTGEAGTITPALVKLIDGEAYMFECQGEARLGFKFGEYMRIDKYTKFSIDRCANITRLIPESK